MYDNNYNPYNPYQGGEKPADSFDGSRTHHQPESEGSINWRPVPPAEAGRASNSSTPNPISHSTPIGPTGSTPHPISGSTPISPAGPAHNSANSTPTGAVPTGALIPSSAPAQAGGSPAGGYARSAPAGGWQTPTRPHAAAVSAAGKTPKGPKKRGGGKAGLVAAMLCVSLVGGAAGGGATYLALSSGGGSDGSGVEVVDTAANGDVAPASTNTGGSVITAADPLENSGGYSLTQVVEKASVSVVEISTEVLATDFFQGSYTAEASGSGVVLSADGYIVTNDHVVEDAQSITVRTADGEEYEAVLIGTDAKSDLAVLKIDARGLTPAAFADSDAVQVGQTAVAIGNPLGTLGGTVTEGIISAKDREITIGKETMTLLQTSAAVNPGNSGGGLFNDRGELVGVVNAKSYGAEIEGLGFAIPSNTVAEVAEQLIEHGYVTGRPQLGISIVEVDNPQAALYYRVETYGIYIAAVSVDNGLQSGDRVISVNGKEIEAAEDISAFVEAGAVGDVLEFVVVRDGQRMTIDVELTEKVPEYIQQSVESEKL